MSNSHQILFSLLLATVSLSGGLSAQDRPTSEDGWSILRQDMEIFINAQERTMEVAGTLEMQLDGQDSSLGPTVGINSQNLAMSWKSLQCDGAETEVGIEHPTRKARRMARVRFAEPKSRGDRIKLRFACVHEKSRGQLIVAPGIALASWGEVWYPVPDPAQGVSLGKATRARGRTKFFLPKGWSAVTNGEPVVGSHGRSGVEDKLRSQGGADLGRCATAAEG